MWKKFKITAPYCTFYTRYMLCETCCHQQYENYILEFICLSMLSLCLLFFLSVCMSVISFIGLCLSVQICLRMHIPIQFVRLSYFCMFVWLSILLPDPEVFAYNSTYIKTPAIAQSIYGNFIFAFILAKNLGGGAVGICTYYICFYLLQCRLGVMFYLLLQCYLFRIRNEKQSSGLKSSFITVQHHIGFWPRFSSLSYWSRSKRRATRRTVTKKEKTVRLC